MRESHHAESHQTREFGLFYFSTESHKNIFRQTNVTFEMSSAKAVLGKRVFRQK